MTPHHYSFLTTWRLRTPLAPVWRTILDGTHWPEWWKGVEQVTTVRPGGANSVGLTTDQVWKSALPYRLRMRIEIVKVEELQLIEVTSDGALRGTGIMRFSEDGGVTEVRFTWDVSTTEWWMNLLAPLLTGIFRWNHAYIMNAGARCLATRLNVPLISTTSS